MEEEINTDDELEEIPHEMIAESKWDKGDTINVVVILLLLIATAGMVYFGFKLREDTISCIADPLAYYHSLGQDRCFCMSGYGAEETDAYIDRKISERIPQRVIIEPDFNYSEWESHVIP